MCANMALYTKLYFSLVGWSRSFLRRLAQLAIIPLCSIYDPCHVSRDDKEACLGGLPPRQRPMKWHAPNMSELHPCS